MEALFNFTPLSDVLKSTPGFAYRPWCKTIASLFIFGPVSLHVTTRFERPEIRPLDRIFFTKNDV